MQLVNDEYVPLIISLRTIIDYKLINIQVSKRLQVEQLHVNEQQVVEEKQNYVDK